MLDNVRTSFDNVSDLLLKDDCKPNGSHNGSYCGSSDRHVGTVFEFCSEV